MKKKLKVKTAGAGSKQDENIQLIDLKNPDGARAMFSADAEATPPDIIVEN